MVIALVAIAVPRVAHAFTALDNHGGPILPTPEIAPIYIGPEVDPTADPSGTWEDGSMTAVQNYLTGFVGYLNGADAPRGREQVLRQYGVTGASLLPPTRVPLSASVPVRYESLRDLIYDAQYVGGYPYAPGRIVLVITRGLNDVSIVQNGVNANGVHNYVAGADSEIYAYASHELEPTEDGFQRLVSHELMETATDPYWDGGDRAWTACETSIFGICIKWAEGGDRCGPNAETLTFGHDFGHVQQFVDNLRGQCDAWSAAPQPIGGDFDGDGNPDIALVGRSPSSDSVPVAYYRNGRFDRFSNKSTTNIRWASQDNVTVLSGDFDGDGASDIAMVGGIGWESVPVALSRHDGSFNVVNQWIDQFAEWAALPNVQAVAADFDGDGKTDIALGGGPGWTSVPIAFSNGDGTFRVTNNDAPLFAWYLSSFNMKLVAGHFREDGLSSVAILGLADFPVVFADWNGAGLSSLRYVWTNVFTEWSALPGVVATVGDLDGNGLDDIALSGGPGWYSIPMAFSSWTSGQQTLQAFNTTWPSGANNFGAWATEPGARPVTMRLTQSGFTVLALTGGWGWTSIPVDVLLTNWPNVGGSESLVLNDILSSNFPLLAQ
jgi:hypothetical protein